jgi:thiol-disulfide isomerase/thioredoxin
MKKLLIFLLGLLLSTPASRAQALLGQPAPNIHFGTVLNGPQPSLTLAQLRGKVVLLDFWATYCGPCLTAMPHLQALQQQFGERLQVVAVSPDSPARLGRFLQARPSNLLFASVAGAAGDSLQRLFAYQIIPHSVLLDAAGRVVASTEPRFITAQVIEQVLKGQEINLPLKQEIVGRNAIATYFPATAATPPRFLMQPALRGVASLTRCYPQDSSAFHNRRLTALNITLPELYRLAYGGLPYGRTLDLRPAAPSGPKPPLYCLDIIVAKGQEASLLPTMRQELAARFDLRATLEPRPRSVYLLRVADARQLPPATGSDKPSSVAASAGAYQGANVTLAEVADYLEGFGLVELPVLLAAPTAARYNLEFSYQPEKPGDLRRALADLGLVLEKAERPVEMLVLR